MTKFNEGDILYYINPFTFHIEQVRLTAFHNFDTPNEFFWIDQSGAYLAEEDLCETIEEAKDLALAKLESFYNQNKEIIEFYTDSETLNDGELGEFGEGANGGDNTW